LDHQKQFLLKNKRWDCHVGCLRILTWQKQGKDCAMTNMHSGHSQFRIEN